MLAIVVAVRVGLGLEMWQAAVASGLGWLLIQIWRRTLGRPIYALGRWLQRRAAGVPLQFTLRDIQKLRHQSRFLENWLHRRGWQNRFKMSKSTKGDQPHG
jgi:hypothetical protein